MTDKDRKAFEREAATYFARHTLKRTNYVDGHYVDQTVNDAWLLWQACAAHYAPKLTDRAIDLGAHAILETGHCGNCAFPEDFREIAKAALRAAGARFEEEA